MAYKKRYKKSYRRRYRRNGTSEKKIKRIAQKVINHNLELKEKIWSFGAVGYNNPTTTTESFTGIGYGTLSKICRFGAALAQGYADGEYTGNEFRIKGIHVRFSIGDPLLSTYATPAIRFIMFRPISQSPNWNTNGDFIKQLLSNTNSGGTQYLGPVDTDFFKVYWDKTMFIPIHYNPVSAGSVSYTPKILNKFLKFPGKGFKVQWDQTGFDTSQDVYLAAISSIGANPYVNVIAGQVKMYYTDG